MMDITERYLDELVKRCMIQVSLKEGPAFRKFESFRLHDLMRDLCLAKARDESFLKVIDHRNNENPTDPVDPASSTSTLHRVVIYLNEGSVNSYVPPGKQMIRHVRSLTFHIAGDSPFKGWLGKANFNSFRMLRALTIENESVDLRHFTPDVHDELKLEIGDLIHLRYLCIRVSFIIILPSSIGNLEHLETLDLRDCTGFRLPKKLRKMRQLRHLYLPHNPDRVNHPGTKKVRLAGLINLEILENLNPKDFELKDFCKLNSLQVLSAHVYGENDAGEIMNSVSNSPCLKQATLYFHNPDGIPNLKDAMEKLFASKVYHLTLDGYLGAFPKYRPSCFQNLIEFVLEGSGIQSDPMKTLENLRNLQKLSLKRCAFTGSKMTCHSWGFRQLRFLMLSGLEELEEWKVEEGALAKLSHLEIQSCPKLKTLPDGLRFISTLKQPVIRFMPDGFCHRIRTTDGQEGEDFRKVRRIPSVVI